MAAIYDRIGVNYAALRRPDPRIAAAIWEALGPAETVLNVGAGTGSYEPVDRAVTAVEPSARVGRWRTLLLDLRTGEISLVGDGVFPVFAGLGPENPAARLLISSTEGLLLYDPASRESRPLPRGE